MTLPLLSTAGCTVPGTPASQGPAACSFHDLDYPMAVAHLDLGDVQIAYSERRPPPTTTTREALLLLHGLGSYMPVWRNNIAALARDRRVVAIDLPGYGKSSKAGHPCSMAFFADVVERVIARLGLAPVVLVGHSMGGQIALTHALRYPGRARSLVLLAPAGLETFTEAEGQWLRGLMSKDAVKRTPPEIVRSNIASNFVSMPEDAAFLVEDRLRIVGGPDFDGFADAVSRSVAAMLDGPVWDRLPEIEVPALVIFGSEDAYIPNRFLHRDSTEAVARRGVERLRNGRLVLVPRAGHMVQFEKPEVVNRTILSFL